MMLLFSEKFFFIDTTIKNPKSGGYLVQQLNIKCSDKKAMVT